MLSPTNEVGQEIESKSKARKTLLAIGVVFIASLLAIIMLTNNGGIPRIIFTNNSDKSLSEIIGQQYEYELVFPDGYELLGVYGRYASTAMYICKRPDSKIIECRPTEKQQIEAYKHDSGK